MTLDFSGMATPFGAPLAALMSGGISIDFDRTFVVQMVVFATLIVVLKPLLFDPVLAVFEEREKRTEGARAEARKMQEEAGELLRRYETELEKVSRAAADERDRARSETAKLEAEILDEARAVSQRLIEEGRRRIGSEVGAIRADMERGAEQLARDIAGRVLGREVGR